MLGVLQHFRLVLRSMRNHYRHVERVCGVGGAHVWALAQIAAGPGIRVSELARQLGLHQSTTSNMVDRLARTGLVERTRSSQDARRVLLYATDRGRAVLEHAPPPVQGVLQAALLALPASRLAALRDDLDALVAHIDAGQGEGDASLAEIVAPPARRRARRGHR